MSHHLPKSTLTAVPPPAWPMYQRVWRSAELLDRMIAVLGIHPLAAVSLDAGQAYFEARSRCIACARAGDCRVLLDAAPDPACALKFCPNAVYFSRCRPDTAPP